MSLWFGGVQIIDQSGWWQTLSLL